MFKENIKTPLQSTWKMSLYKEHAHTYLWHNSFSKDTANIRAKRELLVIAALNIFLEGTSHTILQENQIRRAVAHKQHQTGKDWKAESHCCRAPSEVSSSSGKGTVPCKRAPASAQQSHF